MRLVLAFAALVLLASCTGSESPDGAPDLAAPSPVAVSFAVVTRDAIVEPIVGSGTITAHKTTILGPRVSGIVDEIYVAVGDHVEAAAPLFRTRPSSYEIRAAEAASAARLARAEADKAERDLRRLETLHTRGVASDEQMDGARTAFEMAAARLSQAAAALAQARQELADTVVRAPYAGVITQRYVDEGVMMSTVMSSSSQVVQLMKVDVVVAIVQIPEVHLPRVRVGTPARVAVDGTRGEYATEVHVLNDRVDPVSRAFEVRLGIQNPDLEIKPGLFAEATLLPEPREATKVDRRGVLGGIDSRYVFLEAGGRAMRRSVSLRELDATHMEVIEGLVEGERVLVGPNLPQLTEGTPVAVEVARANR